MCIVMIYIVGCGRFKMCFVFGLRLGVCNYKYSIRIWIKRVLKNKKLWGIRVDFFFYFKE